MRSASPFARVFLLAALFVILAVAPGFAATSSPAVSPPAAPVAQAAAPAAAAFLATLSTDLAGPAAPIFTTGCTSNDQCPTGQLCCLACGANDCTTRACFTPIRGHCPLFS